MAGSRRVLIVVAVFVAVMLGVPWVGAVPDASAQIAVTAADPPAGEQGTLNLSVKITGKGFKNGAKATFFKTKTTDPAGVNVKSTQFVSSTQLMVLVDIADGAALSLFDIQVANTDGRTGKGTELFKVTVKGDSGELSAVFDDSPGFKIRSDGRGAYFSNQDTPSYPNNVELFDSGSLYMRIQRNRQVIFDFSPDGLLTPWPILTNGTIFCREWSPSLGTIFYYSHPPAFLSAGGQPNNEFSQFATGGWFPYDEATDTWGAFDNTPFNLKTMPVGGTAFVLMNVRFDIVEQDEPFGLAFGYDLWEEAPPMTTVVQLTHPTPDTWQIDPMPPGHSLPNGRTISGDQANFYLVAPSEKRSHGAGNCDLGIWSMPFRITLTKR